MSKFVKYGLSLNYEEFPSINDNKMHCRLIENDFIANLATFLNDHMHIQWCTANATAKCLFAKMSDTALHYHTHAHVLSMLQFTQDHPDYFTSFDESDYAAIWFHDAIYKPSARQSENEYHSVQFTDGLLGPYIQRHAMNRIKEKIISTAFYNKNYNYNLLLLDLDLCALSFEFDNFRKIQKLVVAEHNQYAYPLGDGQRKFLAELYDRPEIYRTEQFKPHEQLARSNIKRYIDGE